jgi:hypothetical protein
VAIERHGLSAGSQNALPRAGQEPGCAVTLAVARLHVGHLPIVICLPGPRRAGRVPHAHSAVQQGPADPCGDRRLSEPANWPRSLGEASSVQSLSPGVGLSLRFDLDQSRSCSSLFHWKQSGPAIAWMPRNSRRPERWRMMEARSRWSKETNSSACLDERHNARPDCNSADRRKG